MALSLVTAPTVEPLTVAEAKAHLRLDSAAGEPAPTAPTVALASPAVAGNVDNGAHRYRVTFVTADGETEGGTISDAVTVADKTVNGKVELTSIPLGGSAVTSRKLYRTTAGGSSYLLLATIANNTATTYTDNIADSALGAAAPTTNTTEDPTVNALVVAARMHVETWIKRPLCTQTWDLFLECFPRDEIVLPCPPVQTITHVKYRDTNGTLQTWDSGDYQTSIPDGPYAEHARIMPAYGEIWPTTRSQYDAVEVEFVCGYGAAVDVPEPIKQAMKLMIGHWYENRQAVEITGRGELTVEIPLAAQALLAPFSALRFG